MKTLYICVLFLVVCLVSSASAASISPRLEAKLSDVSPTDFMHVKIVMAEQVKTEEMEVIVSGLSIKERRRTVVSTLKAQAATSQRELLSALRALESKGLARDLRSLWIVNCVTCELTPGGIRSVAGIKGVKSIDLDEAQMVLLASKERASAHLSSMASDTAWGVKWIRAPEVWDEGYRGQNVIIGELDTGVDYTHSDLASRAWTNPGEIPDNGADDDGNGYTDDYYGYDFNSHTKDPMDDHGHGTHVAGTICGDGTGGTLTGVAPEAKVMALKVLSGTGNGEEADVWEAIQYAVDNGAHAMSLSIGWVHSVHNPDRPSWRTACENAMTAGVTMCVASGNERMSGDPAPDNVRTPGDCPPPWLNPDQILTGGLSAVVTVGATAYKDDSYATFSSYGPVTWENESPWFDYAHDPEMGLIDPDVCAPGTDINSTVMGGGYSGDTWSGTSMATPHVSGAAALILSKNPLLLPADVDEILETTAIDLGPLGKDNDYGAGRIDVYEAYMLTPDPTGPHVTFRGHTVYDTLGGDGDGSADPGETVVLTVTLGNGGVDTARTTTAVLTTSDAFVTVLDSLGSFGDIAPAESSAVNESDPFTFELDNGAPREHLVYFTLSITANSSAYTATRHFSIMTGIIQDEDPTGPDAYGYYCYDVTDVRYTEVPTYNWRAIDTTQTLLPGVSLDLGDDEVATIGLPFTFPYYGIDYDSLTVSSDGWVSLITASQSYHNNRCLPTLWPPEAMIAGLWDDLDPGNTGAPSDVYYYYDDTAHVFVVEFFEVEHYPATGLNELFEFVLYDPVFYPTVTGDGEIEVHYVRPPQESDITIAMENQTETDGLWYKCDGVYEKGATTLASSFAIKFTTDPPELVPGISEGSEPHVQRSKVLRLEVKPNPFSTKTVVAFSGPESVLRHEDLSLEVFDISGRLLRTLTPDEETNSATILWDGRTDIGERAPSGVYFVRLAAGGQSVTRKAVLLR